MYRRRRVVVVVAKTRWQCCCSCSKDQVAVYNVAPRRYSDGHDEGTLVGVYCGDKLPGPQMSEENSNQMTVRLTTNDAGVQAGFRAKYEFVEKSPDKRTHFCTRTTNKRVGLMFTKLKETFSTHCEICFLPCSRFDI